MRLRSADDFRFAAGAIICWTGHKCAGNLPVPPAKADTVVTLGRDAAFEAWSHGEAVAVSEFKLSDERKRLVVQERN